MNLKELRALFKVQLSSLYNEEEIDVLFYEITSFELGQPTFEIREEETDGKTIDENRFSKYIEKLKTGEPIQYVLHQTNFYGYSFFVDNNVLIPRPETEELVEWVLQDHDLTQKKKILEVGTGSGAIPITLNKKWKYAEIQSVDYSEKALEVARKNAHNLQASIDFIHDNFLHFDVKKYHSPFDIIVSNPPYIRPDDYVAENVYEFEPKNALFVTGDPLIFYRKIIEFSKQNLNRDGGIYVEINQFLAQETQELFKHFFQNVILKKDISGNYRMIKAYTFLD